MGSKRTKKPERVQRAFRVGIADALFTRTQQRLMALLFGQAERSFFTKELIALAGGGSGAVQRELKRLSDSELVLLKKVGNQKHYQANTSAPVFEELRGLVMKTVGLSEPLREALAKLGDRVWKAMVFGSVAKHRDRAVSDIDVLVVGNGLTLEELFAVLAPIEERLARKVHPVLYTREEFERRREAGNHFLTRVLESEPMVLIGGQGNDAEAAR